MGPVIEIGAHVTVKRVHSDTVPWYKQFINSKATVIDTGFVEDGWEVRFDDPGIQQIWEMNTEDAGLIWFSDELEVLLDGSGTV